MGGTVTSLAIVAAIRARHCRTGYENWPHGIVTWHWVRSFLDTCLCLAPLYLHVPITVAETDGPTYDLVIRVYPYARDMARFRRWLGLGER